MAFKIKQYFFFFFNLLHSQKSSSWLSRLALWSWKLGVQSFSQDLSRQRTCPMPSQRKCAVKTLVILQNWTIWIARLDQTKHKHIHVGHVDISNKPIEWMVPIQAEHC